MSLEGFIAKRIYSDSDEKHKVSRPAIRIAMLGIIIGLAVMIISIGVVMGFKREVSQKVIGFGSHIQVLSLTQNPNRELLPILTSDSLEKVIRAEKEVLHVQRYVNKLGMLKTNDDFRGVQFKGVGEDYDLSFFEQYLKEGKLPKCSSEEASNEVLISRQIATDLGLEVGKKVFAYFIGNNDMRARRFTITGIYETNLTEYDRTTVVTDIYTMRKLYNWEAEMSSGFEITIRDFDKLPEVTDRLVDKINHRTDKYGCTYGVYNIKELAPNIFSWLGVLDMNVVMILVLMICVASFTVMSGLLIIMLERINMIGLLKAMGATDNSVRGVFSRFSLMLVGRGMIWGNVIGLALCLLQQKLHIVHLDASVYYVDSVPVEFNWWLILAVNVITIVISAIVIYGSSFMMGIGKPAKAIRFD